jgi:hypothetical protein
MIRHAKSFLRHCTLAMLAVGAVLAIAAFYGYACYESGYENARDEIQQQKGQGL